MDSVFSLPLFCAPSGGGRSEEGTRQGEAVSGGGESVEEEKADCIPICPLKGLSASVQWRMEAGRVWERPRTPTAFPLRPQVFSGRLNLFLWVKTEEKEVQNCGI